LTDFIFGYAEKASVFTGDFEGIVGLAYPGLNQSSNGKNTGIAPFFD